MEPTLPFTCTRHRAAETAPLLCSRDGTDSANVASQPTTFFSMLQLRVYPRGLPFELMPESHNANARAHQPLLGRTALVTGGARRIGRAIGLALASAGADVAFTYNRSRADADDTLAALRGLGARAHALPCDLHNPEAVAQVLPQLAGWLASGVSAGTDPALDILVNNAGAFEVAGLDELTVAQWDAMFATNTRAPFLMAQAALPYLRRSPSIGRIVNLGSLGGMHPWATHAHYCASKAALHMLTQTMAKGWAPEVAANCVAPGMIVTGSEPDEAYAHFAAKTPMQRNGTVGDVAELVVFLASATPFLTGQVIAVDGGLGL
jgi:NAD(P)-dependent dehydrogenase (short-subunit alcohol dehydrogenase family)